MSRSPTATPPWPTMSALPLIRSQTPFDHPDWCFELKYDGWRALCYVANGDCQLVSRRGIHFTRFTDLERAIAHALGPVSAVLDGELVVLDASGRPQFHALQRRASHPLLYAFDLLWLEGDDLRDRPLSERKAALRALLENTERVRYLDAVERTGVAFYEHVCAMDLEGIVAKPLWSPYRLLRGTSPWVKIKNPSYSQAQGRGEGFNRSRRR